MSAIKRLVDWCVVSGIMVLFGVASTAHVEPIMSHDIQGLPPAVLHLTAAEVLVRHDAERAVSRPK